MTFNRTRCAHCRQKLTPERHGQIVHIHCIEAWSLAQAAKREREERKKAIAAAKVDRAETRRRKVDESDDDAMAEGYLRIEYVLVDADGDGIAERMCVYRLQGSTFNTVLFDWGSTAGMRVNEPHKLRKLLYVAATRASSNFAIIA